MSKEKEQIAIFDDLDQYDLNYREWKGMPEYNNEKPPEPVITVTIKFQTVEALSLIHISEPTRRTPIS